MAAGFEAPTGLGLLLHLRLGFPLIFSSAGLCGLQRARPFLRLADFDPFVATSVDNQRFATTLKQALMSFGLKARARVGGGTSASERTEVGVQGE